MRVIKPTAVIETPREALTGALQSIERFGRVCYKSEDKITQDSAEKFVRMVMKRGHLSVIEHFNVAVRFITNRGVTHELVRHRLAAYSQESTRYCNYGKDKFGNEITFVEPYWWGDQSIVNNARIGWEQAMRDAEDAYFAMLKWKLPAQAARGVLPNDLKTEIVMTCNLREWLHVFKLRTAKAAHPDMRRVMIPLLKEFQSLIPVIYDNIEV